MDLDKIFGESKSKLMNKNVEFNYGTNDQLVVLDDDLEEIEIDKDLSNIKVLKKSTSHATRLKL